MTHPWITELGLTAHPEGGWYAETWRSAHTFEPTGYAGPRAAATGIYFALLAGEESAWHLVRSDELWLWHAGGPLALRLGGSGAEPAEVETAVLGPDVAGGARPQLRVPGGVWQSALPLTAEPVLVSCVVSPGFDFADFRMV
ncbi:cupin domain-containing protein [Asanoa siamensis]|uniref:Cupin n=1 Tax=Asanoa siamensis TaxID=926357 RepID=A0ABQ4D1B8_9ACTN|nr:cupin domain-containing protein [Asanoa siamensis]GIF77342.1 cupin [Asanoa siamensis]